MRYNFAFINKTQDCIVAVDLEAFYRYAKNFPGLEARSKQPRFWDNPSSQIMYSDFIRPPEVQQRQQPAPNSLTGRVTISRDANGRHIITKMVDRPASVDLPQNNSITESLGQKRKVHSAPPPSVDSDPDRTETDTDSDDEKPMRIRVIPPTPPKKARVAQTAPNENLNYLHPASANVSPQKIRAARDLLRFSSVVHSK